MNYSVPSEAAKHVFNEDPCVLQLMASRDQRVSQMRDALVSTAETWSGESVITKFIQHVSTQHGGNANRVPYDTMIDGVKYTFPGHDVYAMWVCVRGLVE